MKIKPGTVFATRLNYGALKGKIICDYDGYEIHNEILSVDNGIVTIAQYSMTMEDEIRKFTVKEINYMIKKNLLVTILER